MKNRKAVLLVMASLLFLGGCWDQDQLKEARLVYAAGLDLTEDGKQLQTVIIRQVKGSGFQAEPQNEIYSGIGNTTREARDNLDRKIAGEYRSYKNRVILLGEELAKKDIYPHLDVIYRDPKSALNAHIVVAEGRAADILAMRRVGGMLIAEYLDRTLNSEAEKSLVPRENIQSICAPMLDPGKDFTIPYVRKTEEGEVEVAGQALFSGHRMNGVLWGQDSILLQIMRGELGDIVRMTLPVHDNKRTHPENYITIDVEKVDRKMEVLPGPGGDVRVKMQLKMFVNAIEYPDDHLDDEETKGLSGHLSKLMTQKARGVLNKLQEANCDVFGIGRELIAYHPEVWAKKRWDRDYQKVKFEPKVEVKIVSHGVIN
ncbi:Ger(x)C family spore germination protein [Staphylospora marina]|uniref:Ger(x)C family spore germination protein n=1 Tax=Staphylospora marina TaxID=2490858 RepID=UPI000F5BAAA0|nr:Ger(x)C family spore germination protein [Staphylospora marina]